MTDKTVSSAIKELISKDVLFCWSCKNKLTMKNIVMVDYDQARISYICLNHRPKQYLGYRSFKSVGFVSLPEKIMDEDYDLPFPIIFKGTAVNQMTKEVIARREKEGYYALRPHMRERDVFTVDFFIPMMKRRMEEGIMKSTVKKNVEVSPILFPVKKGTIVEAISEVMETGDGNVMIVIELPGISKEQYTINLDGKNVIVEAQNAAYHSKNVIPISFEPSKDKMETTYNNGILQIDLKR